MRGHLWIAAALAAASAPAWAAEQGEGGLGRALITPAVGTFFWTLVTFLFMLVILGRFAWRPLLDALKSREQSIEDSLEQARREREQAEALLREQHALVADARRERAEALNQGQRDAERVRNEILEEARRQREQLLAQTENQVAAAVRQAHADLRAYTADLAILAAGKLLARNLDETGQRKVVEDYLKELESRGMPRGPLPS